MRKPMETMSSSGLEWSEKSHGKKNRTVAYKNALNSFDKKNVFSVRLFVGFAWSFVFFIPATTANDLRLQRISIPDIIHYIIFLS